MANHARAITIGQPGLWLVGARHHHLVSGATPERGGSGEAWRAAELLLAALTSCATSIVTDAAATRGLALNKADIEASSERDPDDPGRYAAITLDFLLYGVTQAQAEELVAEFQSSCPIYGTLSRGAPLSTTVRVAGT